MRGSPGESQLKFNARSLRLTLHPEKSCRRCSFFLKTRRFYALTRPQVSLIPEQAPEQLLIEKQSNETKDPNGRYT